MTWLFMQLFLFTSFVITDMHHSKEIHWKEIPITELEYQEFMKKSEDE